MFCDLDATKLVGGCGTLQPCVPGFIDILLAWEKTDVLETLIVSSYGIDISYPGPSKKTL